MTGATFLDVLGWFAFALNVWGNLLLTSKGQSGWVVRLACNVCWLPYAVSTSAWALLANHALFMGINCYGWWRWRCEARDAALRFARELHPPARCYE